MIRREIPREVDFRELAPSQVETITRSVFALAKPQPSDLMLIFGVARSSGNWCPAAELIRSGLARRVLISGGVPYDGSGTISEAQGIRSALVELGIGNDVIMVEERSRNTMENVIFSREFLRSAGEFPASVVFYCKSHHAGRVWRTMVKHMPRVVLSCSTYDAKYDDDGVSVRAPDWHQHVTATRRVLAEYERILRYSLRGDIA